MAKKRRKSVKKSVSMITKRATRRDTSSGGEPLKKTPIILHSPTVKKFIDRWVDFYGLNGLSQHNELWGVYPMQTLTQEGLQVIPREDGRIVWILQAHVESDIRWTHLNVLSSNNDGVTVTEIEISGDMIEVNFVVNSERSNNE